MIKVVEVEVEELENPGCNNGNYPRYMVTFDDGTAYSGITCRCGKGCAGTERLPKIGEEFADLDEFFDTRD